MSTNEPIGRRDDEHGLGPEEVDELLGAYVLDALDDHERAAVERHLATDLEATAEVARLRAALDEVVAADAVAPRPALWDAIASQLDPGEASPDETSSDHAPASSPAAGDPAGTAPPARRSPADELATRRARRTRLVPALAAAAAILLVLAGVVIGRTTADDGDDLAVDLRAVAARVAAEPGARQATLTGSAGSVTVVVDTRGRAYLDATLAALPEGRTYQLWAVDGSTTVSLGLLGAAPSVAMVEIGGARTLAITAEVAGGVVQSTGAPVAAGELA